MQMQARFNTIPKKVFTLKSEEDESRPVIKCQRQVQVYQNLCTKVIDPEISSFTCNWLAFLYF